MAPVKAVDFIRKKAGLEIVWNDSCCDIRWDRSYDQPEERREKADPVTKDPFNYLAGLFVSKIPCARMDYRKDEIDRMTGLS